MTGSRILIVAGLLLALFVGFSLFMESDWEGVDVAVVETKAEELGAEASSPFLNIEGDFLLFVFTAAGAAGGFIAGYYWREMFGGQGRPNSQAEREPKR
jgi:cobalt/nickel transport protein